MRKITMGPYLVTTPADLGWCPRCSALVIVGWLDGRRTRCEPWPVDLGGEIVAIVVDRPRYAWLVDHRLLPRSRPGGRPRPVLVGHRCGQPLARPADLPPHVNEDPLPPF